MCSLSSALWSETPESTRFIQWFYQWVYFCTPSAPWRKDARVDEDSSSGLLGIDEGSTRVFCSLKFLNDLGWQDHQSILFVAVHTKFVSLGEREWDEPPH